MNRIEEITSRQNPRVKSLLLDEKDKYLFFEGEKLVLDLIIEKTPIYTLIVSNQSRHLIPDKIDSTILNMWVVSPSVMKKLSGLKTPPPILAIIKQKKQKSIKWNKQNTIFVFNDIQDPANAGTVFRSAVAFGVDTIIFTGKSVEINNRKFLRTAQNSVFKLNYQYYQNLSIFLEKISTKGIPVYLTSSGQSKDYIKPDLVVLPCVIIFGNEGKGLEPTLLSQYSIIKIPQTNQIESLNLGVSASILMYEILKKKFK